jgi:hypothetical protein
MSRSGYSEDCENLGLWRGAVHRAISGKRGQALLREMAEALDAMPVKQLVADDVVRDSEHVCAMGAVIVARKLDVSEVDVYDADATAELLGIAGALAKEIAYENDECGQRVVVDEEVGPFQPWNWPRRTYRDETPAERWTRMREWVTANLRTAKATER